MSSFESRVSASTKTGLRHGSANGFFADLHVRRLCDRDQGDIHKLLVTLDDSSRLSRFNQLANDAYLALYAESSLANATWIAGAFVGNRLRGFVEVYDAAAQGFAEAAFLVESGSRRRGIGSALLRKAKHWAVQSNIPKLRMIFSSTNLPMRKLAGTADARLAVDYDDITADIDLCVSPIG